MDWAAILLAIFADEHREQEVAVASKMRYYARTLLRPSSKIEQILRRFLFDLVWRV